MMCDLPKTMKVVITGSRFDWELFKTPYSSSSSTPSTSLHNTQYSFGLKSNAGKSWVYNSTHDSGVPLWISILQGSFQDKEAARKSAVNPQVSFIENTPEPLIPALAKVYWLFLYFLFSGFH